MEQLRVPLTDLGLFMAQLELSRGKLTRQEYKTLQGQALHGDVCAAVKGLNKILRRLNK